MRKELHLWRFVAERLVRNGRVMLLVVAESSGSSPGRQGYKMAVGEDGGLIGSIGGGIMEVNLVEESRRTLDATDSSLHTAITEQVHRKSVENASGMICSGRQSVIFRLLTSADTTTVQTIVDALEQGRHDRITITSQEFTVGPSDAGAPDFNFEKIAESGFQYTEKLGFNHRLYIIGGGHCALALSELMSKLDFHISIFDDRADLNTIAKNEHADDIKIIDSYERIGDHIPSGRSAYVVVMTLGYKTDEQVIRSLIDKEFKYFGVLGSKAKMSAMFKSLRSDGFPDEFLSLIRTPIGLPINSRTPAEIAVSIAAEIIAVKNG